MAKSNRDNRLAKSEASVNSSKSMRTGDSVVGDLASTSNAEVSAAPKKPEPLKGIKPDSGNFGRFKTYNAGSTVDERLGFINRDSLVTERVRVPMVVNPLGRDYLTVMNSYARHLGDAAVDPSRSEIAETNTLTKETVPGILALDLEFTPVHSDYAGNNYTTDIFLAKWIASRYLDNMVKNWQQGDIGALEITLQMIRAYVAHIRRILEVMRDVYQDSKNLYYSPVALLNAMGLYMTEQDIRTHYEEYWRYFNTSIIGLLNSVTWIEGAPGHYRWASLMKGIYKDNPAKTRYTQLFLFRPARMYELKTEEDGWHIHSKYKMSHYFDVDATNPDTGNPQGIWQLLRDVNTLIRQAFYDDSTQDMLATMNALVMRGKSDGTALGSIKPLSFEYMDFESHTFDMPFIFDLQMLIAIQNATICYGLEHSDLTINPNTGDMRCKFWGDPTIAGNDSLTKLAFVPKIINMPTYAPTQSDMFNATQWTVTAQLSAINDENTGFYAGTFGSDVIVGAWFVVRNLNVSGQYAPVDPSAFTKIQMDQTVEVPTPSNYDQTIMARALKNIMYNTQFAFAPQQYIIEQHDDAWYVRGSINQSEIYFVGDQDTLLDIHRQWLLNYWGYPMVTDNYGSPDFSAKGTEVDPF